MLRNFRLRSFVKKAAWHLYAWAENLNDSNPDRNGEAYFVSNLPLPSQTGIFTAFDVGANVGDYSQMLLSRIPNAEVHLFDPMPGCIAHLIEIGRASCRERV